VKPRQRSTRPPKVQRERFTALPTELLVSRGWIELPPPARVIFVDMCKRHLHGSDYRPTNNGKIGYGCADGGKAANVSPSTAWRMLKLLQKNELIRLRREGVFRGAEKVSLASEWEILIYPMPRRPFVRRGDRRLHIRHWMLNSPAYSGLSNPAKCLLFELMRRFDGGNNGCIVFGGPQGGAVGLSDDITERGLTELKRTGFIMMAAPAVPYQSWSRQWRLTMYPADGKAATKDFMRVPKRAHVTPAGHFIGADDPLENVSTMRLSANSRSPISGADAEEETRRRSDLKDVAVIFDTRASETFEALDTRAHEIHLETSLPAQSRSPDAAPSTQRSPEASDLVRPAPEAVRQRTPPVVHREGADLFGAALPTLPKPQDELRRRLRTALSRRRGTQSRLAVAAGLSPSAFAHALSGRRGFTPTVATALRRWLDNEPVVGDWPTVPPAAENEDAA
jgi:hypothetical protein